MALAALGSLFVWLSQIEALQQISRHLVRWGERHPLLFYASRYSPATRSRPCLTISEVLQEV